MLQTVPSIAALTLALLHLACAMLPSTPLLPGEGAARLRALHSAAQAGEGLAQAQLGVLYSEGATGIERDPERAYHWLSEAAKSGCAASQLHLGLLHLSGEYVDKDLDRAAYWLRLAADQGRAAVHERLLQVHANDLPLRLRVAYEWVTDPLGEPPGIGKP